MELLRNKSSIKNNNKSSGSRIRNKLFWKLGIHSKSIGDTCSITKRDHSNKIAPALDSRNIPKDHKSFSIPESPTSVRSSIAQCGVDSVLKIPPLSLPSCLLKTRQRGQYHEKIYENSKGVVFNEKVLVMTIPSRNDYSARVKQVLWVNQNEMLENAQRNAYEFVVAEGRDWRRAGEESEMYFCEFSNGSKEFVHPIHFQKKNQPTGYRGKAFGN